MELLRVNGGHQVHKSGVQKYFALGQKYFCRPQSAACLQKLPSSERPIQVSVECELILSAVAEIFRLINTVAKWLRKVTLKAS